MKVSGTVSVCVATFSPVYLLDGSMLAIALARRIIPNVFTENISSEGEESFSWESHNSEVNYSNKRFQNGLLLAGRAFWKRFLRSNKKKEGNKNNKKSDTQDNKIYIGVCSLLLDSIFYLSLSLSYFFVSWLNLNSSCIRLSLLTQSSIIAE